MGAGRYVIGMARYRTPARPQSFVTWPVVLGHFEYKLVLGAASIGLTDPIANTFAYMDPSRCASQPRRDMR